MLFDLRGRGRRRAVQSVYLGLALLIGGGLVLFGVGTGSGGGVLSALTGNGSGAGQNAVISQQERDALRQTSLQPRNPAGWEALLQVRWSAAARATATNGGAPTFTAAGMKELHAATQAWQRYLQLARQPDPNLAILAARAYGALGQYANAAAAWEISAGGNPASAGGFECLAVSAYAAGETRKGDLALGKALTLVPRSQRAILKQQMSLAKRNPQVAKTC